MGVQRIQFNIHIEQMTKSKKKLAFEFTSPFQRHLSFTASFPSHLRWSYKAGSTVLILLIDSGLREQAVGWLSEVLLQTSVAALPHSTQRVTDLSKYYYKPRWQLFLTRLNESLISLSITTSLGGSSS